MATLKKIRVTLDGGDFPTFDAWSSGEKWNGFEVPYFEYREAQQVAEAARRSKIASVRFDGLRRAFVTRIERDPPRYDESHLISTPSGRKEAWNLFDAWVLADDEPALHERGRRAPSRRQPKSGIPRNERAKIARLAGDELSADSTKEELHRWFERRFDTWDRHYEGGYTLDDLWNEIANSVGMSTQSLENRKLDRRKIKWVYIEDLRPGDIMIDDKLGEVVVISVSTSEDKRGYSDILVDVGGEQKTWRYPSESTVPTRRSDRAREASLREDRELRIPGWSIGWDDEISAHAAVSGIGGDKLVMTSLEHDSAPRSLEDEVAVGLYRWNGDEWEQLGYADFDSVTEVISMSLPELKKRLLSAT